MTQTPTKAEELAARLESGWCPIESPADMERAAAELRRLAAVEAERDDLKLALAHTVRLVQDWTQSAYAMEAERDAMRLDYSRLLEKHNNLHTNAARDRAERDALQRKVQEMALQALADDTQHREVEAERDALAQHREPLTDGQIVAAANEAFDTTIDLDDETLVNKYGHGIYISRYLDFARAIEAAHGIGATTGEQR